MTDRIQRIQSRGHVLFLVDGELQPKRFAAYIARHTKEPLPTKAVRRAVSVPLVLLTIGGKLAGCRVSTWCGERCASIAETRAFLRHDGYSVTEVESLFALARRERVTDQVRKLIARGITA